MKQTSKHHAEQDKEVHNRFNIYTIYKNEYTTTKTK